MDAIEPRTKRVASIHEVLTSLVLSESCECYVPTSLGAARVAGYLWHRQGKTGSGWKRRFAACCANFIVLFNENDAPAATSLEVLTAKPVGALCFEDLEVGPMEPPPAERDVADYSDFAFTVGPADENGSSRGGGFFSGAVARRAYFCAESEGEMQEWVRHLLVWRHSSLCEDRSELAAAKQSLAQATEQLEYARREAADAKAEASGHQAASEATHSQALAVEEELRSVRIQLEFAQNDKMRAEGARRDAMADRRKQRIFTALHKAAREELQLELERVRQVQQLQSSGGGGSTADENSNNPEGGGSSSSTPPSKKGGGGPVGRRGGVIGFSLPSSSPSAPAAASSSSNPMVSQAALLSAP